MQLTYRGQHYHLSTPNTVNTIHGLYRGISYTYAVQYQPSSLAGLTYRGISDQPALVPVLNLS